MDVTFAPNGKLGGQDLFIGFFERISSIEIAAGCKEVFAMPWPAEM